ncbi:MAG: hypothetical protein NXY57DRAFT_1062385 [Lentinula lateritia]|nr:MAG: hypothetical protein NXY57DRAFT_1062385 [Lentinula lateritia]
MSASNETVDVGKIVIGFTEPTSVMEMFVLPLYGVYTALFGLYIYLQIHQQGQQHYYQFSLSLLYVLSTTAVVISILIGNQMTLFILDAIFTKDIDSPLTAFHFNSYANLVVAAEGIYVVANFIADALLVYRCYAMWSSRTYVISGLTIISLVNTTVAIFATVLTKDNIGNLLTTKGDSVSIQVADTIISYAFLSVNLFTNLLLTGLIAGRIWWMDRAIQRSLTTANHETDLNTMVAIILESGLLYPIALIICLVLSVYEGTVETFSLLTLIVGIAATLIIVRTDLKISIENAYCPGVTESLADEEEIPYDLVAIHTKPQPYMLHKEHHFKPVKMGQHF